MEDLRGVKELLDEINAAISSYDPVFKEHARDILLGTRFVQGFIFWGGATRRLIYDIRPIAGVDHAVK